jgi:hypothetical protein
VFRQQTNLEAVVGEEGGGRSNPASKESGVPADRATEEMVSG